MLIKIKYFLVRTWDVARDEGLVAVGKKFYEKLSSKLQLVVQKISAMSRNSKKYQEIYTTYLSNAQNNSSQDYINLSEDDLSNEQSFVKFIAFYLPQYHPFQDNDNWWGKGFTEWNNVSKAVPQFVGHYQPHLPGELGFYDLRVQEVQQRQVELAKKYGISGFCFYYYWFNGKRLLENPLDQFTSDPSIDFPFCLCWANENWTRQWDGLEQDILIAQNYSEESDIDFIEDLSKYLNHKRYIRINDRPVLMIYRAQLLPNIKDTALRWRQYCLEHGIGDIYLIAVETPGITDPVLIGFDAVAEFPPHGISQIVQINNYLPIVNNNFSGQIYDYRDAAKAMMNKPVPDYTLFKTVFLSWDNTARRQNNPLIFHHCSPSTYQTWLSAAAEYTYENLPDDKRFIFINAWNEWAEGTHLEPDRKYGYGYLQATGNVAKKFIISSSKKDLSIAVKPLFENFQRQHKTAIILHLYYEELWEEISLYLDNLSLDFDLFISLPKNAEKIHDVISERFPLANFYECQNRGRDIGPFLKIFSEINKLGYSYICKIHTKKSSHRKDGDNWRNELYEELLGSPEQIQLIKIYLDQHDVGIIGPKDNLLSTEQFIGGNQEWINNLADKLNLMYYGEPFIFIAGTMFWFKPEALAPILRLQLSEMDFSVENGEVDATLAHALERFFGLLVLKQGYQILQTGTFSQAINKDLS